MNSFFAPGRTELAGNHTDHQKGRVLASAVDKGIHAFVEPNFDNVARIRSAGFPDMDINLLDLDVHPEEFGSSAALVRGVASAMYDIGASFGGFDATLESELSAGSGLSSSAAFAVLMCRIFNGLYNNSELEPYAVARVAQQAENLHFGKPCGLMDQLACSLGKAVYIDFLTGEIIPVNADFSRMGLTLCLTDTGTPDLTRAMRASRPTCAILQASSARSFWARSILPSSMQRSGTRPTGLCAAQSTFSMKTLAFPKCATRSSQAMRRSTCAL